jgi:hypothetical protein
VWEYFFLLSVSHFFVLSHVGAHILAIVISCMFVAMHLSNDMVIKGYVLLIYKSFDISAS